MGMSGGGLQAQDARTLCEAQTGLVGAWPTVKQPCSRIAI